jgi:YebC/PmpR family DNA-binding regulatory protein
MECVAPPDVVWLLGNRAGIAKAAGEVASIMSGHSKWHNIKLKKGKVDAQRGALFTKLSKEIILAAKGGSPDPEANYRLKMAVEKAREFNVPQDNIKRAIARGAGQTGEREIEELRYEGYGPHGVAVVADAATDNRNRTAGELRFLFTKHGGTLGETGSVGWMFDAVGVVEADPPAGSSEDRFTEDALVDGVEDVEYDPELASIYTDPTMLGSVRDALQSRGLKISDVYLGMRAKTKVELHGNELEAALAFFEALDEHEDVRRIFGNLDVSDASLEALA